MGYTDIYRNINYTCKVSFGGYRYFILGNETISGLGKKYGTQFAISNNNVRYRIKPDVSETWSEWINIATESYVDNKIAAPTKDTYLIKLNDLTWNKSSDGKFFANTDVKIDSKTISASISNWTGLRVSDELQIYTYYNGGCISLTSNVNSFVNSGSTISVTVCHF